MGRQRTTGRDPLGAKSTLEGNHRFPTFYACYLLKSARTSKSSATYIGSTPNPPRRLRQHNGELTAGASKTARNRPWVMQMIVHGFPSKLAALKFEWAWQNPLVSRHVRDALAKPGEPNTPLKFGKKGPRINGLKANIKAVRVMLSTHPYTTWPLHVKLFTEDAIRQWTMSVEMNSNPKEGKGKKADMGELNLSAGLPQGSKVSIELEGVDGKALTLASGCPGRTTPIEVTDAQFTLSHLAKFSSLLSTSSNPRCSVCKESLSLADFRDPKEHLAVSLCPHTECQGVAHISCMSHSFLEDERSAQSSPGAGTSQLIPRGGACPSCRTYTLWGDIIRGCYRRFVTAKSGVEATVQEEEDDGVADRSDEKLGSSNDDLSSPVKTRRKKAKETTSTAKSEGKPRVRSTSRRTNRAAGPSKSGRRLSVSSSSSGEEFDLNVSGSESDGVPRTKVSAPAKRARGRPKLSDPIKKSKTSARSLYTVAEAEVNFGVPMTPRRTVRQASTETTTMDDAKPRKIRGISKPIRYSQAVDLDDISDSSLNDMEWVRNEVKLKRPASPVAIHDSLTRSLSSLSLSTSIYCDVDEADDDVFVLSD